MGIFPQLEIHFKFDAYEAFPKKLGKLRNVLEPCTGEHTFWVSVMIGSTVL